MRGEWQAEQCPMTSTRYRPPANTTGLITHIIDRAPTREKSVPPSHEGANIEGKGKPRLNRWPGINGGDVILQISEQRVHIPVAHPGIGCVGHGRIEIPVR